MADAPPVYDMPLMHTVDKHRSPPAIARAILGDGDVELFRIAEGFYDIDVQMFFSPDDIQLISDSLVDNQLKGVAFGCCLARFKDGTNVMFDAGPFGPLGAGGPGRHSHPCPDPPPFPLVESLKSLGLAPKDVHFVVYSHVHGDHVGWAATFTHAVHVMHRAEYEYAMFSGCPWHVPMRQLLEPLRAAGRLRLLDGEEAPIDVERLPGVSLLLVRGHTPGHACVRLTARRTGDIAYYIGDAVHALAQLAIPQLTVSPVFDACGWRNAKGKDVAKMWSPSLIADARWSEQTSAVSRKALMDRAHFEKALLISPHFPSPGIGRLQPIPPKRPEVFRLGTADVGDLCTPCNAYRCEMLPYEAPLPVPALSPSRRPMVVLAAAVAIAATAAAVYAGRK